MSNSIPLRYDYMSHLPFFPAEGSKGCEIEEIRDPRGGYIHAKGQQIFTDLESSGHGKKDVGTLVSYRQDEGKTFPCQLWYQIDEGMSSVAKLWCFKIQMFIYSAQCIDFLRKPTKWMTITTSGGIMDIL